MRIISKRTIRDFAVGRNRLALAPLEYWYSIAKKAAWKNPAEVRRDFNAVDFVGDLAVFDVGGNKYRLIASIKYRWQILYIRRVLTHAEYDKGDWKS